MIATVIRGIGMMSLCVLLLVFGCSVAAVVVVCVVAVMDSVVVAVYASVASGMVWLMLLFVRNVAQKRLVATSICRGQGRQSHQGRHQQQPYRQQRQQQQWWHQQEQ